MRKRLRKIDYDVILHFITRTIYPSHFPKFCPISKTIKNAKTLLVFGENNSPCSSILLHIHIFWNFEHISRVDYQISYRNIGFPKVIIFIVMATHVLFSMFLPKRTRTLMLLSSCSKIFHGLCNGFILSILQTSACCYAPQ